mmetsp:Transcript_3753/g.11952  ORF Transcript_3753/g.11952 Transcript_3753/m.11952 type:complete len:226 (-) Transcript_3753:200-877(-)
MRGGGNLSGDVGCGGRRAGGAHPVPRRGRQPARRAVDGRLRGAGQRSVGADLDDPRLFTARVARRHGACLAARHRLGQPEVEGANLGHDPESLVWRLRLRVPLLLQRRKPAVHRPRAGGAHSVRQLHPRLRRVAPRRLQRLHLLAAVARRSRRRRGGRGARGRRRRRSGEGGGSGLTGCRRRLCRRLCWRGRLGRRFERSAPRPRRVCGELVRDQVRRDAAARGG